MNEIKNFLEAQGYHLIDRGEYWSTAAKFRNGIKETSVNIDKKTGRFVDWVSGARGSFKDLVCLITGSGKISDAKLLELINNVENQEAALTKIKVKKKYDPAILERMLPDYSYFLRRGISERVQKLYKVGLITSGKLRNRYTIPIFEYRTNDLIGFSGRFYKDEIPDGVPKWKHIGRKVEFLAPLNLSDEHIRDKKEIVLVESLGDCMALAELNVINTICLFGTKISPKIINYICGIEDLKKVWISLNDDIDLNGGVGNEAAKILEIKLAKFINKDKIYIKFPPKGYNDWSEYWEYKNKLI